MGQARRGRTTPPRRPETGPGRRGRGSDGARTTTPTAPLGVERPRAAAGDVPQDDDLRARRAAGRVGSLDWDQSRDRRGTGSRVQRPTRRKGFASRRPRRRQTGGTALGRDCDRTRRDGERCPRRTGLPGVRAGGWSSTRRRTTGELARRDAIIRQCYSSIRIYVPLLLRAYELWGRLEQEAGRSLYRQTGC